MRAEVTQVGWDGAMWRRSLNTAGRSDALAAPVPYRPVPGTPIYHLRLDDRDVLIADHDLRGPLRDLVTAVLAWGETM